MLSNRGVIFYGMVIGRLPFRSHPRNHNETIADENRKIFISEIKHGLIATHAAALKPFSAAYRIVIRKMLVPAPKDRASIIQLKLLPWLCCSFAIKEFSTLSDQWIQSVALTKFNTIKNNI